MNPRLNIALGDWPQFVRVGDPPDLWETPQIGSLFLSEIDRKTGGALLIYSTAGIFSVDWLKKFDTALPLDYVMVSNIEKSWYLTPLIDKWKRTLNTAPKVISGLLLEGEHFRRAYAYDLENY